ncbi:Putative diguanylate cyclase, signal transduction family protein (GGDEF domain protein) [Desulfamplus magnetovallimortis]|uniref:diguanylate cyclase n=1 Tax=Desulfamplus magnetovallimortis TaxID=1246637 RepID=A0A1W1H4L2_9BACT|nr:diguanylate cyclase [Desulfamplus magnetovallimortis]SLM27411.1 Putative diguanylate cyclase, signal transduction family protein (GGDEF domain protein) [Desulfamplus magnetovallimortis]
MATEQDKDQYILELKSRAEKLQSQKDILMKELTAAEETLEATVNMYARYFPAIIDYIKDTNTSFVISLKELGNAIKNGDSPSTIENLLSQVQTSMLKESPPTNSKGKSSIFSSFFKNPECAADADAELDIYLESIKTGYINLTNSMKETLDSTYGTKLNQIATKFQNTQDFETIRQLQDELFSLIQQYIYNIGSDREKMVSFVKEIVKRILQIEAGMTNSFMHNNATAKSNEEFENLLNTEIGELKTNIDVSERLQDLKNHVSQTLSSIETALKEKTAKDKAVKILSEKNRNEFQAGFSKLKKELDQAIKHSRDLETKLNQDPLTKVYNRRAYHKRISDEMERFLRYKTIFSILVLDIDFFKKVNDTYGHAIGDKCLQEITRRTKPLLRKNDMLARYGGEEFVIVMPETAADGALAVAEKIRQTIEKIEFIYKKDTIKMTVSIGVSEVTDGDKNHEKVFERADAALYRAKNEGRNRVCVESR